MSRKLSILASVILIGIGALALVCNVAGPLFGFGIWRLWPLVVIVAGLFFVLPPLLAHGHRGLGGLFIPGMPILTTGSLLFLASVLNAWEVWAWLWPQEVLALALGFLFAAATMRSVWLLFPAVVVGANGLLFQFCALTGWWESWALLWTIEPLAIGVALLVVNIKQRSQGLALVGLLMCALAGLGFVQSLAIVSLVVIFPWWLWRWVGPVSLILAGLALLTWSVVFRPALSRSAVN